MITTESHLGVLVWISTLLMVQHGILLGLFQTCWSFPPSNLRNNELFIQRGEWRNANELIIFLVAMKFNPCNQKENIDILMTLFFPFKASFGLNVLWTLLVSQTWYRKIYENSLFFLSFLLRDNFINWMIFFNAIKQRHWWRRVVYCLSKSGWDCETYIVMVLPLVYYDKGCLKEKKNPS